MASALALSLALLPAAASAATITVAVTDDAQNGSLDDNGCTLRDAIQSANLNMTITNGCNGDDGGGTGLDTILLQGGQTYKLSLRNATDEDANASGDLDITGGGGTIIRSTGPGLATIDADNVTVPGPPANQRERALDIRPGAGGVTFEDIRVTGGADGGDGGGLRSFAPLTLTDSEVTGNLIGGSLVGTNGTNFGGGGILIRDPGSLTLNRSTVAGNSANAVNVGGLDSARGGGISYFSFSAPMVATNSTISGNVVDSGGNTTNASGGAAIYWEGIGTTMNLTNDTIANNMATGAGGQTFSGGLMLGNEGAVLTNTILAGNTAPDQLDCFQFNPADDWTSGSNNVIGDSSGCGHIGGSNDAFFANPLVGTLSNYGGLTRTQILNPGSPAINRGGACPDTDQRGFFRAAVAPCDSGAFELNAPASLPTVPSPASSTGQRAAALKKCKKKRSRAARKKCKKKAALLPL